MAWADRAPTLQTTSTWRSVGHLVEPLRHLTQRDVASAVDVAVAPLDRFAHVEHHEPLGQRVGDAFDGDGGDVHG